MIVIAGTSPVNYLVPIGEGKTTTIEQTLLRFNLSGYEL